MNRKILFSLMFFTYICVPAQTIVTFTKDQIVTIILPTAPDASKGRYFKLDRWEDGKIIFEEELHPQARTPYVIVPNEDFSIDPSTLDLDGLMGDMATIEGVQFIVIYESSNIWFKESSTYFLLDTTPDCVDRHDLGLINGFIHVGSLRAYFQVIWRLGRDWEKLEYVLYDTTTSIEMSAILSSKTERNLYDLQGRKLSGKPARGIYIEDGKKKVMK